MSDKKINKRYATDSLRINYAHVGLLDSQDDGIWIAKKRLGGTPPIQVSHARLITGGTSTTSVADKDRFICYWFNTPNTGEGLVHGYPIEWEEAHIMVRLDPQWHYRRQEFIPATDTRTIDKNIDMQYKWGQKIFDLYKALEPNFPISWHLIGPRPTDSMFYIERYEA